MIVMESDESINAKIDMNNGINKKLSKHKNEEVYIAVKVRRIVIECEKVYRAKVDKNGSINKKIKGHKGKEVYILPIPKGDGSDDKVHESKQSD